jgi:hypothetical protein
LKKAISPAISTLEWLDETFKNKKCDDIIYITSNPLVNPRGVYITKNIRFDGSKYFKRVIDIWDLDWDDNLNTVHPKKVTQAALASIDINPKNRFIVHYMQPHTPYIYYAEKDIKNGKKNVVKTRRNRKENKKGLKNEFKKINDLIGPIYRFLLGVENIWRIRGLFNLKQDYLSDIWYRYGGRKGIIKGYTEDLKLALKYVKTLTEKFPNKKIIITADHGEKLGEEKGIYGHGKHKIGKTKKELIEIPWLEIEK